MKKAQRIAIAVIAGFAVARAVAVSASPTGTENLSTQQIAASQSCRYNGEVAQSSELPSLKADPLYGLDNAGKPVGLAADSQDDALQSLKTISEPSMVASTDEGTPSAGRKLCA
ncbi:hypothetical protein [Burkholderia gladioli]|uniref:hypothetical protein n=1 Tax=Burkholderia gladioli TaxID=28095 RepID=UPI00163FAB92|nr:hypothetical protein [Burkholderia gladioli]